MGGNPSQPLESSGFPEAVQVLPGNGSPADMQVAAVEGKGEVKRGGEDGGSNSGAPHREKRAGESEEFSNIISVIPPFYILLLSSLKKENMGSHMETR